MLIGRGSLGEILEPGEDDSVVLARTAEAEAEHAENRFDIVGFFFAEVVFDLLHHLVGSLDIRTGWRLDDRQQHALVFLRQERAWQL
ncbi:hypothetical protein D3C78_1853400 [compost metagenome]